jgi:NAD(P)-dependent dehydrogenase (short-subunit alcohol dehydrogenase family)
VVTVSSVAHFAGGDDVIHADDNGTYRAQRAYANSKLANLLFATELQRRAAAQHVPLTSTAAHPGVCSTGLYVAPERVGSDRLVRKIGLPFARLFLQSAASGAVAPLYAATAAEPGSYTGPQHFRERRGPVGPARISGLAGEEVLARRLWSLSEDLTGFRYPWPA